MRRVVSVAVVLLVGLALVGCGRSEPDVAAYVGSFRVTHDQVESMARDAQGSQLPAGELRQIVLGQVVARELAQRLTKEKKLTVPPVDIDGTAAASGLPAESELLRLIAETSALLNALAVGAPASEPTEAEQREVFDTLLFNGVRVADQQPFDSVRGLLTGEQLGGLLTARKQLDEAAVRFGVEVNPRYVPLRFAVQIPVQDSSGNVARATVYVKLGGESVVVKRSA